MIRPKVPASMLPTLIPKSKRHRKQEENVACSAEGKGVDDKRRGVLLLVALDIQRDTLAEDVYILGQHRFISTYGGLCLVLWNIVRIQD